MRRSTLLWLVLTAATGTALFHTSQKVHDEREKLATLNANIAKEEESLRVLNAEWSYLNQPDRLEKLSRTYLGMAPMKGSQFIKVEDIPVRPATPSVSVPAAAAVAAATAPKKLAEKKPEAKMIAAKKTAGEKPVKPALAAAPPKPVIKIRKPETAAAAPKPAKKPAAPATVINVRSFSDIMTSLKTGVE
jgi:hypothetical protein